MWVIQGHRTVRLSSPASGSSFLMGLGSLGGEKHLIPGRPRVRGQSPGEEEGKGTELNKSLRGNTAGPGPAESPVSLQCSAVSLLSCLWPRGTDYGLGLRGQERGKRFDLRAEVEPPSPSARVTHQGCGGRGRQIRRGAQTRQLGRGGGCGVDGEEGDAG